MNTCLPPEAYYHINRNTPKMKPRFKEPENPEIKTFLTGIGADLASPTDWESAFALTFGQQAFEEDFPCINWESDPVDWGQDAINFRDAFVLADNFVYDVMHRLHPYQQHDLIPAITHSLVSHSYRRTAPIPRTIDEPCVINLLKTSGYSDLAEWIEEQQ